MSDLTYAKICHLENAGIPPGYRKYWEKCIRWWGDAHRIIQDDDLLSEQSAITINKPPIMGRTQKITCYNPRLFSEQGWCITRDSTANKPKWGFCSPACPFLGTAVSMCYVYIIYFSSEKSFEIIIEKVRFNFTICVKTGTRLPR